MSMIIPQDTIGKMATSGAVGMGLCVAVDGMGSRVTIPRFDDARIPLYAASGLAAMAASGASSLAHNILIPALAEEDKWTEATSTAVALISAGAGGAGAWAMMDPAILQQLGYSKAIGYAIVSESVGGYMYQHVVKPMM